VKKGEIREGSLVFSPSPLRIRQPPLSHKSFCPSSPPKKRREEKKERRRRKEEEERKKRKKEREKKVSAYGRPSHTHFHLCSLFLLNG
jgi:hypothetical protein